MPAGSGTVPGGRASGETGSDGAATRDVSMRRATQSRSKELPRASAACFSVGPQDSLSSAT
eukprot:14636778-Alexandrium_andersonii.AAC.1